MSIRRKPRCRDEDVGWTDFGQRERFCEARIGERNSFGLVVAQSLAFVATGNKGDMFHVHDMLTSQDTQTFRDAARRIRGILHEHAVSTVKRPLALLVLLGGFDDGVQKIADIDVLGSQTECDAWAIGSGDVKARELLASCWKPALNRKSGLRLIKEIYGSLPAETYLLPRPSSK